MDRLALLDGARGYLLVAMFVAHVCIQMNRLGHWSWLNHVRHSQWLPVGDLEFFLALSGFVCALSYGRSYAAGGMTGTARAVRSRLYWLYAYQVGATLILVLLARFAHLPGIDLRAGGDGPTWLLVLRSFSFAVMPENLDILMLYFVLLPLMPLGFHLLARGRIRLYFGLLAGVWLVALLGIDARLSALISEHIVDWQHWLGLMGHFNPLSYALLFYTGFAVGNLYRGAGMEPFRPYLRWRSATTLAAIAIVVAAVALVKLGPHSAILGGGDTLLRPLALLVTLAICTLIVVLLNADDLPRPVNAIAAAGRWLMSLTWLQFLGRNSLFVYAVHVIAVALATAAAIGGGGAPGQAQMLLLVAAGLVVITGATALKRRLLPTAA